MDGNGEGVERKGVRNWKGMGEGVGRGWVARKCYFSIVKEDLQILLNCENPSALGTHCMHLQGLLFFIS